MVGRAKELGRSPDHPVLIRGRYVVVACRTAWFVRRRRLTTRLQFLNQLRDRRPAGHHELDPVVAGGVVRGRNHGDAAAAQLPGGKVHDRRRLLTDVMNRQAGIEQPFDECLFQQRRAAAEIPAHADRCIAARANHLPQRTADAAGLVRPPLLAHHAANVTSFENAHSQPRSCNAARNQVVRGSPDPAPRATDRSHAYGRPAVGRFGEVGRPAPNQSQQPASFLQRRPEPFQRFCVGGGKPPL